MQCRTYASTARLALLVSVCMILTSGAWGAAERVLYHFNSIPGGLNPRSALTFDNAGNLYGVTSLGGLDNRGVVYEISPSSGGWTEKTLYSFDAFYPYDAALIFDGAGNLYGVATEGGLYNKGVAFELTPNSSGEWSMKVIHNFGDGSDGEYPEGALIMDSAGNLYGTTYYGGETNSGCAFELSPTAGGFWREQILHSFGSGDDGSYPLAALAFDSAGNLYGTTYMGGTDQVGIVFELELSGSGWSESVLYSFQGGTDGSRPMSNVILDSRGNVYGTTEEGGSSNLGTVFELSPSGSGWTESVIHSFSHIDGELPVTGLVLYGGSLYGTTNQGLDSGGTVYALTPDSAGHWTEDVLYSFTGENGGDYPSGLILDSTGNLYGANPYGYGDGIVFEVTP
jgi:uncharacterized repeat protein (TIGR03803 family)